MIVFDTETTGLLEPEARPLSQQPYIIELAAVKVDDETLEKGQSIWFKAKPPIPLSPVITKITGLTDEDFKEAQPFAASFKVLVEFFLGERKLVAHNLSYDVGMLSLELRRLDRMVRFPWPPEHLCTMELTKDLFGKWPKQQDLYKHYFAEEAHQEHRAMSDVFQLIDIIRAMRADGGRI